MTRIILAALALACAFSSPALAADLVQSGTTVTLPYGEWLVALGNTASALLLPALAGMATTAIYKVFPMARLVLTQQRVEQLGNAVTEYAINAVGEATKDGKLSISVGSAVIAKAVQRGIDAAPAAAMKAVGGPQGLAEVVFRKLNLEDGATAANTLAPVIAALPAK